MSEKIHVPLPEQIINFLKKCPHPNCSITDCHNFSKKGMILEPYWKLRPIERSDRNIKAAICCPLTHEHFFILSSGYDYNDFTVDRIRIGNVCKIFHNEEDGKNISLIAKTIDRIVNKLILFPNGSIIIID